MSGKVPGKRSVTMKFDVDIKFRVSIGDGVKAHISAERLEGAISAILSDWNDGRFPFDVEMINRGARNVVDGAVSEVVTQAMFREHGSVMLDSPEGGGSTAKAVLEASKLLDGL